jgi:hypothetical protein
MALSRETEEVGRSPLRGSGHSDKPEPVPVSAVPASVLNADRFYIDCEFDGHGGPLLSIAIVTEDGLGAHFRTTEAPSDPWVIENVMPRMPFHDADVGGTMPVEQIGGALRYFIGNCERPVIIADSPVDIGRFCAAISTGDDGGWASAEYPQMTFEVHNIDCYPTDLPDAVQHNAWWDAMALRHKLAEQVSA